jgi:hypothetical protein
MRLVAFIDDEWVAPDSRAPWRARSGEASGRSTRWFGSEEEACEFKLKVERKLSRLSETTVDEAINMYQPFLRE